MAEHWQYLVGNLAVVALFISTWVHGKFLVANRSKLARSAVFGALMGFGAAVSMLMSIQLQPGVLFDLRSSLIAIAAFFGGPLSAVIAGSLAIVCRWMIGGAGAFPATVSLVFVALTALGVSALTRGRIPALMSAVVLAIATSVVGPVVSLVLRSLGLGLATQGSSSVLIAVMGATATLICSFFIMRQRVIERERDLLRTAFLQSPDFRYVKSPDSRFVAVNERVSKLYGFQSPKEMVGKTDFDIVPADRARSLMEEERAIVREGHGYDDHEEFVEIGGNDLWFSTSKVPLINVDGETIGIAGVTHDITRTKNLQGELESSRNRLDYVFSGVPDGIAMFDSQGTLVYRNEQYRTMFPLTTETRRSGQHIRDILEDVLATGEQILPKGKDPKAWLEEIVASLKESSEEEIELHDGRWLHLRTRPTADGSALVVVSDVTKIKQAERALQGMTEQLKLLATTDGLTGLTNRRAFDIALETELARCRRTREPLSLLMVDVDRFKTYNDLYGHQAGDEVLKTVGKCLKESLRRPGDVAARYGGEEFVTVLPGTDEDGAFFIADAFREKLAALKLPHKGGDKGYLTASVGLATFSERDVGMNASELVRRADEALYNAKGAGRDRVTGWRTRHEVRPAKGARG
jgi:diguanylate cyclase (GGDEF)-like protein/PAS domain S-box-containing protein